MAGRGHGDARGEIKELVAVYILNNNPAPALGNQRIGTRIGRRNIFVVASENALGMGARKSGDDLGADGQSFSRHGKFS